jgi:Flp pilus assembly protein TadD
MTLLRWKFVLPIIGLALAITAGRMVAQWSSGDEPADPLTAGFAAFSAERYSRAELLLEQARTADPDNGEVYHGLALVALARRGDTAAADALFARSIALPDTSPVAFANYGRFLINEKRYAEAVDVLERGLERDPDFDMARARLAIALYAEKRIEEACRMARSVEDVPSAESPLIDRIREEPACVTR